jgi:nitronate monooxygenase
LLGIRYPIISAPMVRMSGGRLAGAISAAGGLGTFGGASPVPAIADPPYIREQIDLIRPMTDQPFGVGFITQALDAVPLNFEIVLEEKVPIVLFSFADPTPYLLRAEKPGRKSSAKCNR